MSETPIVPERRSEARQRSLLSGKVIFDGHNCTMDCTIRNVSPHGAYVEMPESFRMPPSFDFFVPHRDEHFAATVIWRQGEGAGLALVPAEAEAVASRHRKPTARELQRERRRAMFSDCYI